MPYVASPSINFSSNRVANRCYRCQNGPLTSQLLGRRFYGQIRSYSDYSCRNWIDWTHDRRFMQLSASRLLKEGASGRYTFGFGFLLPTPLLPPDRHLAIPSAFHLAYALLFLDFYCCRPHSIREIAILRAHDCFGRCFRQLWILRASMRIPHTCCPYVCINGNLPQTRQDCDSTRNV